MRLATFVVESAHLTGSDDAVRVVLVSKDQTRDDPRGEATPLRFTIHLPTDGAVPPVGATVALQLVKVPQARGAFASMDNGPG